MHTFRSCGVFLVNLSLSRGVTVNKEASVLIADTTRSSLIWHRVLAYSCDLHRVPREG